MFNLLYSASFQNRLFLDFGIDFPREDFHAQSGNIFCVADGVTRDTIEGTVLPAPTTIEKAKTLAEHYPNPSGAFMASQIVVNEFIRNVQSASEINCQKIKSAVRKANRQVWTINRQRDNIDYLGEDLYCCEASGGFISDSYLYCFNIGDCYVSAFDKNGKMLFSTENDHLWMEDFESKHLKFGEYQWEDPRYRLLIRGALRNNFLVTCDGKKVGYGALTGESRAMDFVKTYKVPLNGITYIAAYTDGAIPYFSSEEETQKTLANPARIEENGKERTLILYSLS